MYLRKKYRNYIFYILLAFILVLLFLVYSTRQNIEPYQNLNSHKIDYYVITMGQQNRLENIEKQLDILKRESNQDNFKLNKIDAINGDNLDLNELVSIGKLPNGVLTDPNYESFLKGEDKIQRRKYEVGCYLSHVKSIQAIADSGADYGIIFEDDFEIQPGFFENLDKAMNYLTLNMVDFDILFLGMNGPGIDIKPIGENVFKQSCEFSGEYINCYGLHGYLIPRMKAQRIVSMLDNLDDIIDVKLLKLGEEGKLTIYRLIPDIVKQNSGTTGSVIR